MQNTPTKVPFSRRDSLLLGFTCLALSFWLGHRLIAGLPTLLWDNPFLPSYLLVITIPLSLLLLLGRFRHYTIIRGILRLAGAVLQVAIILLLYLVFGMALFATITLSVALSVFLWRVWALWSGIPTQAVVVPSIVLALLLFTYGGRRFVAFLLRKWMEPDVYDGLWVQRFSERLGHQHLLGLLRPQIVTAVAYSALALVTLVAHIEAVSGRPINPMYWWPIDIQAMLVILGLFTVSQQAIAAWTEQQP